VSPFRHPTNTRTLGAPSGWDQAQLPCDALPVTDDETEGVPVVASYWEPTLKERLLLAEGGLVRLEVCGRSMPPVLLVVEPKP
jgi:hypothetical protein